MREGVEEPIDAQLVHKLSRLLHRGSGIRMRRVAKRIESSGRRSDFPIAAVVVGTNEEGGTAIEKGTLERLHVLLLEWRQAFELVDKIEQNAELFRLLQHQFHLSPGGDPLHIRRHGIHEGARPYAIVKKKCAPASEILLKVFHLFVGELKREMTGEVDDRIIENLVAEKGNPFVVEIHRELALGALTQLVKEIGQRRRVVIPIRFAFRLYAANYHLAAAIFLVVILAGDVLAIEFDDSLIGCFLQPVFFRLRYSRSKHKNGYRYEYSHICDLNPTGLISPTQIGST